MANKQAERGIRRQEKTKELKQDEQLKEEKQLDQIH